MKKYHKLLAMFVLGFITLGDLQAEDTSAPQISNKPLLLSRSYDRSYINNKLESNHKKRQQLIQFHTVKRDRYFDRIEGMATAKEDLKEKTPLFTRSYNRSYINNKLERNRKKLAALVAYREKRLAKHLSNQ